MTKANDLQALQERYPDAPIRILQEFHSGTGTTEDLERILNDPDLTAATNKQLEDMDRGRKIRFGKVAHYRKHKEPQQDPLQLKAEGKTGDSEEQAHMARMDMIERQLKKIPFEQTDIRLRYIAERNSISDWLDGTGTAPTAFDKTVLGEFPSTHLEKYRPDDAPGKEETDSSAENYFILSGDYWKVRFNGGKETIIGAKAPIKTLVEYLRKRDNVVNPSELYSNLHGTQPENTSQECNLMAKANVSGLNRDATKTLTAADTKQYRDILSEKIERKNLCVQQGRTEEAETLAEEIDKILDFLQKEYGVVFDTETGEIKSANRTAKGRDMAAENTKLHIKRAIEVILKDVEGLSGHLEEFLQKNKNFYKPPQDFPNWLISD